MQAFTYTRPEDERAALDAGATKSASYIAGGTTLLDLMKLGVMSPEKLIDVRGVELRTIETVAEGVRIGAMASNTDVAYDATIRSRYPVLSEALLSGASPQLRNMATVGGNLLQRTRCPYFRDPPAACNKRSPGSGCSALDGVNRSHAVLGGSPLCVATHASDMCVALSALDAVVETRGPKGARSIPVVDFHLLPGDHPERETVLEPGELIVSVFLPTSTVAQRSRYSKVRDRASYAFALASVAAALEVRAGSIAGARLALGGVGTKPWRAFDAEKILVGRAPDAAAFREAADVALRGAAPLRDNAFKVELARRMIVRAFTDLGDMS